MSRRDDMIAALACRPAQGIPIWELEFHAWDAASGRHLVLGDEFARLSEAEQDHALHANAEIMAGVCREFHYAALTGPHAYWHQAPGQLAYYVLPGEARFRQMELLRALLGDELLLIGISGGVLGGNYDVEFCQQLFDAPEEIDEMAQRCLQQGLEDARRFRDAGAGAVVTASDLADNSGPFFPPAQMRRFILPYLHAWAEGCHVMGLATILHSDGRLTPYLNDIADTALDALQAIDGVAGMDMAATLAQVGGRLCLCGNIDCGLLLTGTPDTVYAATEQLRAVCRGHHGWVLGASNAVQREVPIANYRAMLRAAR